MEFFEIITLMLGLVSLFLGLFLGGQSDKCFNNIRRVNSRGKEGYLKNKEALTKFKQEVYKKVHSIESDIKSLEWKVDRLQNTPTNKALRLKEDLQYIKNQLEEL